MENKKLLIIVPTLYGGGAERVISRLAEALSNDCEVLILTFPTPEQYPVPEKVRILYLKEFDGPALAWLGKISYAIFPIRRLTCLCRQITALKRREKVDVTLSFLRSANLWNALSGGGGRKVMSERNNPMEKGQHYWRCCLLSYPRSDKVIFQTRTALEVFPARIRKKGIIIPNPIRVSCLAAAPRKKIVTMGRLHPQKNQTLLIRAFALFLRNHPGYTLHLYGKDKDGFDAKEVIAESGLEGKVILEGFHADVHASIADAEQFVLSSDYEGMPNALLEAMMMGLPCISTQFEGATELIGDSGACLMTPKRDVEALAAAMSRLSDDPALRESLSKAGRRFAGAFSVEQVIPLWRDVLLNDTGKR